MMTEVGKISGGIYLVADASLGNEILLTKIDEALRSGVRVVQLYNTENEHSVEINDINKLCNLCHQYKVPILVNNNRTLFNKTLLDGVHFDGIPSDYNQIKQDSKGNFYKGITCTNDLTVVQWANDNQFDYISFCSMFPSVSADSCEIVSFNTVRKARAMTRIPIFLAGGIYPDNMGQLSPLQFDGVAVVSGIMASTEISAATRNYSKELNKIRNHES